MYGTVDYFSNCLTASVMNRLANEHAYSLNDCYQQLLEEIRSSEEPEALKLTHSNNLEKAYKLVLNDISEVEEAIHIDM